MHPDARYRRAAAASGFGVWDWNLLTDEIYLDPFFKEMLGYQDQEIGNHLDDFFRLVHPDDRAGVLERTQAHIAGETSLYEDRVSDTSSRRKHQMVSLARVRYPERAREGCQHGRD